MRLILSCPISGPDARDACMGMFLLSVFLLTHQTCKVSTFYIPTFRQQCYFSPRYTILLSPSTDFSLFLLHFECLLQLEQVKPLDRNSKIKNNHLLQKLCWNVNRNNCIETVNLFPSSCCEKCLISAVRVFSLEIRHDHLFETYRFFLTGLNLANLHQTTILRTVL